MKTEMNMELSFKLISTLGRFYSEKEYIFITDNKTFKLLQFSVDNAKDNILEILNLFKIEGVFLENKEYQTIVSNSNICIIFRVGLITKTREVVRKALQSISEQ